MTTNTTTQARHTASAKQLALIARLVEEKALAADQETWIRTQLDTGMMTLRHASYTIDFLFRQPRKVAAPAAGAVTEPGIYERDDVAYKVERSAAGRLYAKVLIINGARRLTGAGEVITASYEYEAGAIARITAADKVSPERARELGTLSTVCVACGRKLEDATSVERGIGPVCAKRFA